MKDKVKELLDENEKLREQCEKLFDALQAVTETAHRCDGWPSYPSIDLDLAEDVMENFKVQMSKLGAKL